MTLRRLPMCAELINNNFSDYSLLDIGCRTMALKPHLESCKSYTGTDIIPAEGVIACNLEKGLPDFEDNSYDVAVALDVLEHLENCHLVLAEMQRVARKAVLVSLPNMYYYTFRLNFLFGKGISGKYAFPMSPIVDRHRWVLSYTDAVEFMEANTNDNLLETHMIIPERGKLKQIREAAHMNLAKKWPNLFAYGPLFMVKIA